MPTAKRRENKDFLERSGAASVGTPYHSRKKEKADIVSTTARTAYRQDTNTSDKDHCLIASDKVEGTELYAKDSTKLGTVRKVMIDKRSGDVRHVVIGYGGLFGMGEDHYPMPFDSLTYDKDKDGYVLNVERDRINAERAPSYASNEEPRWDDNYEREIRLWYFPTS